jgi:hypothetical protein
MNKQKCLWCKGTGERLVAININNAGFKLNDGEDHVVVITCPDCGGTGEQEIKAK